MTNGRRFLVSAGLVACCCVNESALASNGPAVDLAERMKGAERVVVATATTVRAEWRQNSHGDRLIVSQVALQVEETLKGAPASSAMMEVEGGTLDGFTLRVSDLPEVQVGDRAVFFLDRADASVQVPHLRGQGIVKLDPQNHIPGSNIGLNDIRRVAIAQRAGR